jgi:nucleoside 2-deoxyribosyltransferase
VQVKKIYLACPYSHQDARVRAARFDAANRAAGRLMEAGHVVFSPISMTHPIAEVCELPRGWSFWERQDRAFLEWCDEVHVLRLPGWVQSAGVQAEILMAMGLGKKVVFVEVDNYLEEM